jgi:hypothetical protein
MKAMVSSIEWSKASRVRGPSVIRTVEERKKMIRHFCGTHVFNEMLLREGWGNENLILGPVEPVPERYYSTCKSVYKAAYKKYTPGIGIALEPIVNDSANAATYKPVM